MIAVAIDGPSGAGKSTIARAAAQQLGYLYIDTGALYRSVGLFALRQGADPGANGQVEMLLPQIDLTLRHEKGVQQVYLNGENVSSEIRHPPVSMAASQVAAHPAVRQFLLELQRKIARENNVIMDGRDIGTVVLPDAQVKIFLTASAQARAKRRFLELREKGEQVTFEEVLKDIEKRDYNDSHREAAPLCQAPDAVLADTTTLDLEASIQLVKDIIQKKSKTEEAAI